MLEVAQSANDVIHFAQNAFGISKDVMPTSEEAGLKWTVNLGQLLQIGGFAWFAFKFWSKIVVRHAMQDRDISDLKADVIVLREDIKEMKNDMKQLPSILQGVNRQEQRSAAIIGHLKEIPIRSDARENEDSFMDRLAERMIDLGKSNKGE